MAISTIAGAVLFLTMPVEGVKQEAIRLQVAGYITICTFVSLICGALRNSERAAGESAEQERQANNRLNSLFDSITDAFFAIDGSFKVLKFNTAAAEAWGLNESDVGKSLSEALPEGTYVALETPLNNALQLGTVSHVEFHDLRLERWFEVRMFASPDGLFVYFHDITGRLAYEEDLVRMASEQEKISSFLDSLLANAPIGFAFFDRQYRYERINQQLADIHGVPVAEHFGKSLREIVPSTAQTIERYIDEVFATGQAVKEVEIAGEMRGDPGKKRHWLTGFYPVLDKRGDVRAVGAIVIEITQRKDVEDRLRESEERFRQMADRAPVMIWICDRAAKPSWFNQPWLDFRSRNLEDALEEGCFANIHPDDENRVREIYQDAFEKGDSFNVEYRTVGSDGEYRWLLVHGSPLSYSNGELDTYIFSCADITATKAADENLRQVLTNERLARSEAEQANRIKDEFVATLSHELRTPLTTMIGWTELLKRRPVKEADLEDGLEAIDRSARLQLQLINDLLDISRITTGKIQLEMEYAELFDLAEGVVEMVRPMAETRGVLLHLQGDADPIIVRVDPSRFQQVVWNLLTNALKFTARGGEVNVQVKHEGKDAILRVVDSGEGIDQEFLPHVFDRFRQADGSKSRRHGGLGLGLSIAKQLAILHGGNIAVESEGKGKGSAFTISLPTTEGFGSRFRLAPIEKEEPLKKESRPLADICVLLVEDDLSSRTLMGRILSDAGAIVIPADSAPAARKMLRETQPDVMISDIGMPDEDGYQLIRSIRAMPLDKNGMIPAAALTAFASEEDRKAALDAGFQMHLTKPIEADDLVLAVRQLAQAEYPTI